MLQLFCTIGKRISQKVHYFSFPCGESCQFSTGVICPPELGFIPHQRNTNTRTISPHFPLSPLQENSPSQQLFHYLGSESGEALSLISRMSHTLPLSNINMWYGRHCWYWSSLFPTSYLCFFPCSKMCPFLFYTIKLRLLRQKGVALLLSSRDQISREIQFEMSTRYCCVFFLEKVIDKSKFLFCQ